MSTKMPVYFISHGGGPWPWLDGAYRESLRELESSLQRLPSELPEKPKAILMISGHWEEQVFAVMAHPKPPMLYDYGGFPAHTYQVKYAAPGSPELAAKVQTLLKSVGIPSVLDSDRGFDHGTFTPLVVSYPDAEIPVVQLSLHSSYDPELHLKVGRALAPLREQGILIIGSGLSYHNLRLFDRRAAVPSHEFDEWLQKTVLDSKPAERNARLIAWETAPSARLAHPQEDHLIPLMVAVGAAESEKAQLSYHEDDFLGGLAVSSFRFG